MNDEINKIIQSISDFFKLDNALKYYLDRHKAQILLDYITNLQQENEKLKEENKKLKELDESYPIEEELAEAYRREEDYKARIEKADELIKEIFEDENWYKNYEYNNLEDALKEIDKILNGKE